MTLSLYIHSVYNPQAHPNQYLPSSLSITDLSVQTLVLSSPHIITFLLSEPRFRVKVISIYMYVGSGTTVFLLQYKSLIKKR